MSLETQLFQNMDQESANLGDCFSKAEKGSDYA